MKQGVSDAILIDASTVQTLPELAQSRKAILEGAGAALFVCDAARRDFPIVQISPAFTAITGYTNEEAMGGKLSLLYGSKTDARTTKAVNDALRCGKGFDGELLCHRANGTNLWCKLVIAPVLVENHPSGYFAGALTDIAEQKRREARHREEEASYRGVFENAVEGVYQSTPAGCYQRVNQALATMYGYRCPEALMAEVRDIKNQVYADASLRERFQELIEETDQVRGLEYQVRRREGRVIWISENARVVRDANSKVRYYEGFIVEITGRKEAEAALQQSQLRLVETSRQIALAEMANGLVHNIGNALNSVGVSAGVIAGKVGQSTAGNLPKAVALLRRHEADLARFLTSDPTGRRLIGFLDDLGQCLVQEQIALQEELKSLKKSVAHACDIVARQQGYAKSPAGIESVQTIELIEDALGMNANSLARQHIDIVRDYAANPGEVMVQKHVVLQILVNLIRNAQQACVASESPARRLTLRLTSDQAKRRVWIEVRDTGVGIAPENLTRIFHHGFTTRENGHGFGLHSGARMAKEMGGSLTAYSEGVGHGASFIFEFPCQPEPPKLRRAPEVPQELAGDHQI
jgi:PAS domain S-box-containing protein